MEASTTSVAAGGVPEEYIYDLSSNLGLLIREIVPEMQTQGPNVCFKEKARDDFTGWTIWSSSVLLARWIVENPSVFKDKSVLDLGAGCGLSGVTAAVCSPAKSVCVSDFPKETMENLLHNVARNCRRVGDECDQAAAPFSVTIGPHTFYGSDTFRGRNGCAVTVRQFDWDDESTWPRADVRVIGAAAAAAAADGATASSAAHPFETYDIVIAADLFYRRSYSRKVVSVVNSLLRPGGKFICVTPCAREGLALLDKLMAAPNAGFECVETRIPSEWRSNPIRSSCAALSDGDAQTLMASLEPLAVRAHPRAVSDEEARCMFPEIFMPLYEIVTLVYTRTAVAELEAVPTASDTFAA